LKKRKKKEEGKKIWKKKKSHVPIWKWMKIQEKFETKKKEILGKKMNEKEKKRKFGRKQERKRDGEENLLEL